ncbi:xaa-pro dipeptidase, putative [Entamoeba invadens IP1]|uniref:Xaa-pro dipeptidase, putative n=1 Tax=Entamoeba invadens IP1 TaxID=370355 RepID=A0A0A1TWT2_ENTIV|nr:xaa-pro dipeptidase, putative [Entamoeba invadens IP1]ELP85672.1 xaa-pro dipeptidase, putative [Entamoeba invadens IP1]|eukprot:XP_004185018.1 xaa-pro dipeptidase, putative [Entamoeba invadens IP1]
MEVYKERLALFRAAMKKHQITHYYQRLGDSQMTEFVHPSFQRIQYLCGFTGENVSIVITKDSANIWVDGRYYLQAEKTLPKYWTIFHMGDKTVIRPMNFIKKYSFAIHAACDFNTSSPVYIDNSIAFEDIDIFSEINPTSLTLGDVKEFTSGNTVSEKLNMIRAYQNDTVVLTDIDDVAWTFNVRGKDIPYAPLAYAYGVITQSKSYLFIGRSEEKEKIQSFTELIEAKVEVYPYTSFNEKMGSLLEGPVVAFNAEFTNLKVFLIIKQDESFTLNQRFEILERPIKTTKEIENLKKIHTRDSASLCTFFNEVEKRSQEMKSADEWEFVELLEKIRSKQKTYDGPSFPSIISSGKNAAVIHYEPTKTEKSEVNWDKMLLFDIGSQYSDGCTTDVSRTYHFKVPSERMKRVYTTVLKSSINLHKAVFDKDTNSNELDNEYVRKTITTENPEWDYNHATGHGVGYYSLCHQCPPLIGMAQPLKEGMVTSIEPGIYINEELGVRLENVVVVTKETEHTLKFVPLTYVPFSQALIDVSVMEKSQVEWLNWYNQKIREDILPLVDKETQQWILKNTEPYNL